ncbi:MAG: S41 family peptidase, partial [Phycisphaerae bacterium]
ELPGRLALDPSQRAARMLDDGVAYLYPGAFYNVDGGDNPWDADVFLAFLDQAFDGFLDADATTLVIDLRDNPGGSGAMAGGLSGFLVGERGQKLGTIVFRDTPMQLIVAPRATIYRGPVAVLVNGSSMSTSEIMAGGLQDLGRARIFGTPTPGAALPSYVSLLPNGDRFQYAVADYISTSGARLEGAGVRPDDVVPLDRQSLLAGVDPQLQAAVNWLLSESAGTSAEAPAEAEADADAARPTTNPAD